MNEAIIKDLIKAIEIASDCQHPLPERRFHKHNEFITYGLKAADYENIIKTFRPKFLELSLQQRLDLAVQFLATHIGDLGGFGIYIVGLSVKELTPQHYPILDRLPEDFRSWGLVDAFCLEVMQSLLWKYRDEILKLLETWSHSTNRWKRRASIVPFVRKVGKSGEFTDEVLRLCENLIWDEADIVRKGVGWALKDNLRSAPERILPYIKNLRRRGVSSTIILYAIRNLKGAERDAVLAIKKD